MLKCKLLELDHLDPLTGHSAFTEALRRKLPYNIIWKIIWLDEKEILKDHGKWLLYLDEDEQVHYLMSTLLGILVFCFYNYFTLID